MRVAVTGSRNYRDRARVFSVLDQVHAQTPITLLVHGDGTGADQLADDWAVSRGVERLRISAEWQNFVDGVVVVKHRADGSIYNAAAGPNRNQKIADRKPDMLVHFPGGSGTQDMMGRARRAGIKLYKG